MNFPPTCWEYYQIDDIVKQARALSPLEAVAFLEGKIKKSSGEKASALKAELIYHLQKAKRYERSLKVGISSLGEFMPLYGECLKDALSNISSSARFAKKEKVLLKELKVWLNSKEMPYENREALLFEVGLLEFEVGSAKEGLRLMKKANEMCKKAGKSVCYEPEIEDMAYIIKESSKKWKGR
ncbi:MAG: hypothetical protein NZL90_00330 [Aquificaceae bacterium]|nr:hypothetical protein [Aquificaceae bacterium]MDW8236804.1 hypothetical protein [Aquificaceae bacterium]